MKNIIRNFISTIFNLLPLKLKEKLINGSLFQSQFRHYLYPGKDYLISIRNKYFGSVKIIVDKTYPIEKYILEKGGYDIPTLSFFSSIIKEDNYCLDIGGNIGNMTLCLANLVGDNGMVFTFEPGEVNFQRLKSNINLNNRLKNRINIFKIGLSNKEETKYWKEEEHNKGNASFSDLEDGGIGMELSTLDKIVETYNIPKIDFIKIDVEGMEYEVIEGGSKAIKEFMPTIYYESWIGLNKEWDLKQQNIETFLKKNGYKLFMVREVDNHLIEVAYPNLMQNTVAIHETKLHLNSSRID